MSTALAVEATAARIHIGWVVRKTFSVVGQRAGPLTLLALGLIFLPQLLVEFLPKGSSGISLVAGLPGVVFGGAASLITYQQLAGPEPISGMDALRAGGRRFGALWVLGLLSGAAELVGLLLLIVPGLLLMVGWIPATAVVMVEGLNATPALRRAWDLTRGNRWPIAALFTIFLAAGAAAIFLPIMASSLLVAALVHQTRIDALTIDIVTAACVSVISIIGSVGAAAIYAALREAKEGPAATIAGVFD